MANVVKSKNDFDNHQDSLLSEKKEARHISSAGSSVGHKKRVCRFPKGNTLRAALKAEQKSVSTRGPEGHCQKYRKKTRGLLSEKSPKRRKTKGLLSEKSPGLTKSTTEKILIKGTTSIRQEHAIIIRFFNLR